MRKVRRNSESFEGGGSSEAVPEVRGKAGMTPDPKEEIKKAAQSGPKGQDKVKRSLGRVKTQRGKDG